MSTVPTTLPLETVSETVAETVAAALDPTAVTEAAVDIESIKQLMDGFDPAALLPELDSVLGTVATICRVAVLAGPIVLLVMGLVYLLFSPKEANYYLGYRCYFGMGSVDAWRFTQRLAGIVLGGLGLVLTGVMFFVSGSFAAMDGMDMVWKALTCLIWEAVLTVGAIAAINGAAALRFDAKGEYRNRKLRK